MNIDKRWLTTELTEDELLMFFNVASLSSSYQYFDIDTIQAIRPKIFLRNFCAIHPILTEDGVHTLETLKNKILEFEGMSIQ